MPRPPSGLPRRQTQSDPSLGLVIVGRHLAVLVKACGCVLIAVSFRMRRLVGNTQTDGIGKHEDGQRLSLATGYPLATLSSSPMPTAIAAYTGWCFTVLGLPAINDGPDGVRSVVQAQADGERI